MRRMVATAVLVAALAACGAPTDGGSPTFGAGEEPDVDLAALAAQAEEIGVRDCPDGPVGSDDAGADAPSDDADVLPDLELVCLRDGEPAGLAAVRGPAVVNLWASWCGPCREELPLLARLDEELGEQVRVVGIDVADGDPAGALELAERSGVRYPQLFDPEQLTRGPLRVAGLPQTVFVDEQGIMVATERVPYDSYADLTDAVERHLGVRG